MNKKINFDKISSTEFEELCFEIILRHRFSKVIWRQGGADNGRDIEAKLSINNSFIGQYEQKFFFECKKYEKGVPPEKLYSKVAWADAERPQHLVIIVSSYLSNNCRTWIEKIEKQKPYHIHIIEGKDLIKLITPHIDLLNKYFVKDKYLSLLTDTINIWLVYNLTPNFYTYNYLLDHLDFSKLTNEQKVFLYSIYYVHYTRLEELENEHYHGIEMSLLLKQLSKSLKDSNNYNEPVLKNEIDVDTLSSEGNLKFEITNENKTYTFTASEILLNSRNKKKYKLAYYLFIRLNANEAIEILLYNNSDLEFKLRYINNYEFIYYKESVKYLGLLDKYTKKLIEHSGDMK